jgi:hypothetical protein
MSGTVVLIVVGAILVGTDRIMAIGGTVASTGRSHVILNGDTS